MNAHIFKQAFPGSKQIFLIVFFFFSMKEVAGRSREGKFV